MRTRWGPFTALAETLAVEMSTSRVRAVIQRHPPTVMPKPDVRFGASAAAGGTAEASGTKVAASATTTISAHRAVRRIGTSPSAARAERAARSWVPTLQEINIRVYDEVNIRVYCLRVIWAAS